MKLSQFHMQFSRKYENKCLRNFRENFLENIFVQTLFALFWTRIRFAKARVNRIFRYFCFLGACLEQNHSISYNTQASSKQMHCFTLRCASFHSLVRQTLLYRLHSVILLTVVWPLGCSGCSMDSTATTRGCSRRATYRPSTSPSTPPTLPVSWVSSCNTSI